ncbi:hypothetical protein CSUI_005903, partial [Cystoisospora suis]
DKGQRLHQGVDGRVEAPGLWPCKILNGREVNSAGPREICCLRTRIFTPCRRLRLVYIYNACFTRLVRQGHDFFSAAVFEFFGPQRQTATCLCGPKNLSEGTTMSADSCAGDDHADWQIRKTPKHRKTSDC